MKLYEITDNIGYRKYYVRGIKNDKEATSLGKFVFGRALHDVSYYSANASTSSVPKGSQITKRQFKKFKPLYKHVRKK